MNIDELLSQLTREEKIGQLLVQYVYGSSASTSDARNMQRYGVATPAEVVAKYRLGGVIYFAWAENTTTPAQIADLSQGLQAGVPRLREPSPEGPDRVPLLIGTDQETGRVTRIGPPATQFPGAMALGATQDPAQTRTTYAISGTELHAMGINACFAPVADVNTNPANPVIGVRAFGSDPAAVSDHVSAAVEGLQSDAAICAATKHFPGHGDTGTDSHSALPVITHVRLDWQLLDAPPFRAAIAAGTDMIMTGHLAFPTLDSSGDPATLSHPILTGLLREELGYDGVVITDSLQMAGVRQRYDDGEIAVRALAAGADLLLQPADPQAAVDALDAAVDSGRISEQRLDASVRRILAMKRDRGIFDTVPTGSAAVAGVVGAIDHHAWADRITDNTITLLTDDDRLIPIRRGMTAVVGSNQTVIDQLVKSLGDAGIEVRSEVAQPGQAGRYRITRAAQEATQTILVLDGAASDPAGDDGQAGWVSLLQTATERLIVAAVPDPYDARLATGRGSWLLSYSAVPIAVDALARVLLGQHRPTGRLPVEILDRVNQPQFGYDSGIQR